MGNSSITPIKVISIFLSYQHQYVRITSYQTSINTPSYPLEKYVNMVTHSTSMTLQHPFTTKKQLIIDNSFYNLDTKYFYLFLLLPTTLFAFKFAMLCVPYTEKDKASFLYFAIKSSNFKLFNRIKLTLMI